MIQDKEQDWLPGEGNGGMEQLESGGRVSMLVAVPDPPVIIRPVLKDCTKHKQIVPVFVFELIAVLLEEKATVLVGNTHLCICPLGSRWLGQGGGGGGGDGEKPPEPSLGSKTEMNRGG